MGGKGTLVEGCSESMPLKPGIWVAAAILSTLIVLIHLQKLRVNKRKLPPGPPSWPVIGSLMYLGPQLHASLMDLSKKYGAIMTLGLGAHQLIVVSGAEVAEELFRTRDADFASRAPRTIQRTASKYIGYDAQDIAFAEYNPHLRMLRKFCTSELLTTSRLNASSKVRKEETIAMMKEIYATTERGEAVAVRGHLQALTMNIMCQMLFGKRYFGTDIPLSSELKDFKSVIVDVFNIVGRLNLGDLIPALQWFDVQGIEAEYKRLRPRMDKVFGLIVEEHRQRQSVTGRTDNDSTRDFVDVLLAPQGNEHVSDEAIIGVISDMILGGTDTTATALEWCLVEVVRHPDMLLKLQAEIDRVVGRERCVEDSDLSQLGYLQAFVKEIFRSHTPVPITLPRLNIKASKLGGYDIPPLSTVFVNTYAIAHHPDLWEKPDVFNPDRFLEGNLSLFGNDFSLTPFGSGRRRCIGMMLGLHTVQRAFASLVHAFDWKPPAGMKALDVDLSETYCLVLRNRTPLLAMVTPRLPRIVYC